MLATSFIKKTYVLIFTSMLFSGNFLSTNLLAGPTGIITDIFEMQLDALDKTSKKTISSVIEQKQKAFNTVFSDSGINIEIENETWTDPNRLTELVDEVEADLPSSYGTNLSTVTDLIDVEKKISNTLSITKNLKDIFHNSKQAIYEISELVEKDKSGTIIKNLLSYSSGNRNIKYQNIFTNNTTSKQYKNVYSFMKNLDNIDKTNRDTAEKLFALVFEGARQKVYTDNFKNKDNTKLFIQAEIIKKARESNTISDKTIQQLKNQKAYRLEEGWFFDSLKKDSTVKEEYSLLTLDEQYEIEIGNFMQKDVNIIDETQSDKPLFYASKKEDSKIKSKSASNPINRKDKNSDTLTALKAKDTKLKSKIKKVKEQERGLETQKQKLSRLEQELSQTSQYNYSTRSTTSKKTDRHKNKYLLIANTLMKRNSGTRYSEWSEKDKKNFSEAARELYNGSGKSLFNQFKMYGVNRLKEKYVIVKTGNTYASKAENAQYGDLQSSINALRADINSLLSSIQKEKREVKSLESDVLLSMLKIDNSVNDYLDSTKRDIGTSAPVPIDSTGNVWVGGITFNSEDRLAGGGTKLRYWGGNLSDISTVYGGGWIFNKENDSLIANGKITSFYAEHGENTATDNTKQFHIYNNEIDRTSSFFNQDINSLKLERQIGNETLSVQTTGHYDYSAWGEWAQTGGLYTDINGGSGIEQKAMHNNWEAGQITRDLPTQGSATYNGIVNGHYYVNSVGSEYGGKIIGTMSMAVDFANTSVVSGVLNLQKENGITFATAHMDQMQISRDNLHGDNGFAGRLVGSDVAVYDNPGSQNTISGQFNGPNAEEITGGWNVTNTHGELANGIFAGKR